MSKIPFLFCLQKKHFEVHVSDERSFEKIGWCIYFSYRYYDINSIKATSAFTPFLEQKYLRDFNYHGVYIYIYSFK